MPFAVLADKSGLQRLDDVLVSFNKPILPDLIDMRANLIRGWEPGMIMMNVPIGEPEQHLNMVLPEKLHNVIGLFEESGIQCQRGGIRSRRAAALEIFADVQVHHIGGARNLSGIEAFIHRLIKLCLNRLLRQVREIRKNDKAAQAAIRIVIQKMIVFCQKCRISSFHDRAPFHIAADIIG